ncbi:MAG: hypothetical protein WA208_14055 [Thermoanaerobaculia bacterium]
MAFQRILKQLVTSVDRSIAALFLDYEGETVELVRAHDLLPDDLKIIGAYQGIFLSQLRTLCSHLEAGAPHRVKFEFARVKILSSDLKDGYYVVLLMEHDGNEGLAWHRLDHCRVQLLEEM